MLADQLDPHPYFIIDDRLMQAMKTCGFSTLAKCFASVQACFASVLHNA